MRNDEGHQVYIKARDSLILIGWVNSAHAGISGTRLIKEEKYGVL